MSLHQLHQNILRNLIRYIKNSMVGFLSNWKKTANAKEKLWNSARCQRMRKKNSGSALCQRMRKKNSGVRNAVVIIQKILVSVKYLSAILGPEMGAPILWAPGIFAVFLQENLHVHKIPRFRGAFWVGGGGSADFIFMARGFFWIMACCCLLCVCAQHIHCTSECERS